MDLVLFKHNVGIDYEDTRSFVGWWIYEGDIPIASVDFSKAAFPNPQQAIYDHLILGRMRKGFRLYTNIWSYKDITWKPDN